MFSNRAYIPSASLPEVFCNSCTPLKKLLMASDASFASPTNSNPLAVNWIPFIPASCLISSTMSFSVSVKSKALSASREPR